MRRFIIFGYLLFMCAQAVAASPQKTGNPSPWEQDGIQALLEVNWDWETFPSGWKIFFHPARKDYFAVTDANLKRIDVWIRPGQTSKQIAADIAHEFAHVFDDIYLTADLRKEWLKARRLPVKTGWLPESERKDYRFGAGDFAECVSWTVQGKVDKFFSKLGPPPDESQQALIRKWLSTLPKTAGK